jgi:DNA-binding LacI/PurR family transcriptional regulator
MSVTIRDVARLAGVSPGTVSRVIHKGTYVKKETRERVLAAIEKLHYRPNIAASRLVSGKTHVLGLLVPDLQKEYYIEIAEAIIEVSKRQGYSILVSTMARDKSHLPDFLRKGNMDGVLVITPFLIQEEWPIIMQQKIPSVFINYESDGQNYSTIWCDQFKIGYLATKYLIELGHREIGFLTNGIWAPSPAKRFQGCLQAMAEAQLDVKAQYVHEIPQDTPVEATREWLQNIELPSAIFVFSDDLAIYIMDVIKDAGYKIPDEVSVVGCGNMRVSQWTIPPLTTVDQHTYQIGKQSVEMLLKQICASEASECEIRVLEPRLILRQSCRKK